VQIDQFTAFVASIAGDPELEGILTSGEPAKIAALAKSKGFSFSERDIEDIILEASELNESVLDSISGARTTCPPGVRYC
jgi:predicted ribosomally synthesized peptide with nif11-like leader